VRASGAILSIASLLLGLVQAPFLHVHGEETDHPAASLVHLHFHAPEIGSNPTICAHTADDDAIDVEWRIALPSSVGFPLHLAVSSTAFIAAPLLISIAVQIPQPRAHDPPDLTSKQPRSPPA